MVTIIDLYEGNEIHTWDTIFRLDGAYLKASEGLRFNDSLFQAREALADNKRFRVGFYHYAHPELHSPIDEARHFTSVVEVLDRRDLRAALDYEETAALRMGHPRLGQWARDWNHEVARQLKAWPLFYSYPGYIRAMRPDRPIGAGLWLASYARNDGTDHGAVVPPPWHRYVLHQFTSRARITGAAGFVDLSHGPSIRPLLAHPVRGLF